MCCHVRFSQIWFSSKHKLGSVVNKPKPSQSTTEMKEKQKSNVATSPKMENIVQSASILQACSIHLLCGLGLAAGFWLPKNLYSINLVSNPSRTLCIIWMVESPLVILLYSCLRLDSHQCSYVKAVGRSILAVPLGAILNALGAVVLGAPVGIEYLPKTIYWSLLMSSLTFVPAAVVFGTSCRHWWRIFAYTKPSGSLDYMICMPAHGAIIGAWLGAWPMPLDWERLWQEWPVCVTYGAVTGYLIGTLVSIGFMIVRSKSLHFKSE